MLNVNRNLKRYPELRHSNLQAWDSADEFILSELNQHDLINKRILIINDQFGALGEALSGAHFPADFTSYSDSYVSTQGSLLNCKNQLLSIHSLDELLGVYDYALLKIPKNSSFLEDTLAHLSGHFGSNSKLIAASMIKYLPKSSFDLIEKYIGPTTTSLAQKKARLIFASFEKEKAQSPYPNVVFMEGFPKNFIHHANLFSREKLDIGTRFFLEHVPKGNFKDILDLGCGNGIVGIHAKMLNPGAKVSFCDDSYQAILSARANYELFFKNEEEDFPDFQWLNCFENSEKEILDLILCNPPFHQHHVIGDFIAEQMFLDAYRALKKGGRIRVIGNSHLRYPQSLKKIFKNSERVANNQKFMIVDAIR